MLTAKNANISWTKNMTVFIYATAASFKSELKHPNSVLRSLTNSLQCRRVTQKIVVILVSLHAEAALNSLTRNLHHIGASVWWKPQRMSEEHSYSKNAQKTTCFRSVREVGFEELSNVKWFNERNVTSEKSGNGGLCNCLGGVPDEMTQGVASSQN